MEPKKTSSNEYFSELTENAILEYNDCDIDDLIRKNKLYNEFINPAFRKLTEYLIYSYKFFYVAPTVTEAQAKTISFLIEKLPLYKKSKGKAYSYFTIIARNYLIVENRNNYKAIKDKREINSNSMSQELFDNQVIDDESDLTTESRFDFFILFIEYLEKNLDKIFNKKNDYIIANAILEIIRRRDSLYLYMKNKKAIYVLIREMTDKKPQQITKIINNFKLIFKDVNSVYLEKGYIPKDYIPLMKR